LAATAAVYPSLGDQIPTHWNIRGEIDGYGSKQLAFLMPVMMAGFLGLFCVFPWLSPKQFEISTFPEALLFLALVMIVLIGYIHGLTLFAALRGGVDIMRALLVGLLVMFGLLGSVMGGIRRNFWMGVRTPWTLASERVWDDTHWLAGRTFILAA